MLKILFIVEAILSFINLLKFYNMIKVIKEIGLDKIPYVKGTVIKFLFVGIYHFIVCLILWLTFRIKYQ